MSMSNNQVDEPIAFVQKKRRTKRNEVVSNVIASSSHQEFSSRELCQKSSKSTNSSKKLLESKRTSMKSNLDLEEEAQKFSLNLCWLTKSPRSHSKRKGKEVHQQEEKNNTMGFIDFFAQGENKGITICEKSVNSRPEEIMAKTSSNNNNNNNNQYSSSGHILQYQDMANLYQVSLDYFLGNNIMKEMSVCPRDYHHNPRIIVHPSKIIGPSRFSQYYNQYMQRTTSVPAPMNFSLMKLLMGVEALSDEELLYAKELLTSEDISSSSEEQRVQGAVNYDEDMELGTISNFSYMRLLMEDEDSSILSEESLISLSSSSGGGGGQRVQQMSYMDLLTRDDISYMDL